MKVAIAHDYLTQRGGAERVVLSMARAFPEAAIFTALYEPELTFPEFRASAVRFSPLNRVGPLRRHHRLAFPLLAPMFSSMHVDADVVLCSSSGWAHGIDSEGAKIVYCHSPARWLYQGDRYSARMGLPARASLRALRAPLLRWDRRKARGAARYLANSTYVARAVETLYRRDAEVLPPPPAMTPGGPEEQIAGLEPGFFLCVSRLLPYKNVDALVQAFAGLDGARLVVVGDGPDERRLRLLAGPKVAFLGPVTDRVLRWLYANALALVSAAYEDYGLTPLEAASFGKPAAVLRFGGFVDTVVEGETGVFFESAEPAAIVAALRALRAESWPPERLRAHAGRFSQGRFIERLREIVLDGS
ncbi:MAG: glycosyltransferase [Gaiellaceae bacterium]